MMNSFEEQTKQMVEQGKQVASGLVSGGEMLIDADPQRGYFRVKLRNVQPPQVLYQVIMGFCWVLTNGAAMFNLEVKQHIRKPGEDNDE